ncbi:hypothetical protein [Streptomyces griseorubiginosus]|uniref:hypothetical protein n=1 Tax=Streptomyces griseorubiginosus TaxID=67304 RepID=UPI002E7FFD80|nr:hypothetical protein [Streptomyces griseorubiginosus]WUB45890.1 hypothetical protein OHN19_22090 [Streptomyces griseorubiginosus]WUB54411.1 hypothetical protein OG942_22090 [Streptomyces griseorubiginosus]
MSPLLSSASVPSAEITAEISSEGELAPLLTAWDLAHPTAADPDWRHLLDEIAHPRTTEAFHGLASSAA